MVKNGQKVGKNGQRWVKSGQNELRMPIMGQKWSKWAKMSKNGQKWAKMFWNGANLSPNFKMGVAKNRSRQIKIWAKRNFLSKYEVSRANGWGVTAVWKSRLKQGFFKILLWATGGRHRAGKDLKKCRTKFWWKYVLTKNSNVAWFGQKVPKRVLQSLTSSATWWWHFDISKTDFKSLWPGDRFKV